jgi:hypothetical protein
MKLAGEQKEVQRHLPEYEKVVTLLTPKLSGDRLSVAFDEKDAAGAGLLVSIQQGVEKARDASMRTQSMNNLKQIGLAFWNYHDASKHFPSPASHSRDGKPLLSWRVAVLPYLGEDKLYREFHLDESWDSPHNRPLIEKMPAVFRSPKSKSEKGFTNYLVPVGGGAVFSSAKDEPTVRDITDGTSQTIIIVEVDDAHAVAWTKPDDLTFDPNDPKKGIGSLYEHGFAAAFCDGSVHFINKAVDSKILKAVLTRAGGETIDWSSF